MRTIKIGDKLDVFTDVVKVLDRYKGKVFGEVKPKQGGPTFYDIGNVSMSSEYDAEIYIFSPNLVGMTAETAPGGVRTPLSREAVQLMWDKMKSSDDANEANQAAAKQANDQRKATREERTTTILLIKSKAEKRLVELCTDQTISADDLARNKEIKELSETINKMTLILKYIR